MKARDSEKGVEATGGGEVWHLLSGLPLGQLAQPLLAGPHAGVDDLEEELAGAGVEDEDGPVDGLGGQVALKGLVDGHTVHVGVIHKPDDLVAEQLTVVLHAHPGSQQPKNRFKINSVTRSRGSCESRSSETAPECAVQCDVL